MRALRVM